MHGRSKLAILKNFREALEARSEPDDKLTKSLYLNVNVFYFPSLIELKNRWWYMHFNYKVGIPTCLVELVSCCLSPEHRSVELSW